MKDLNSSLLLKFDKLKSFIFLIYLSIILTGCPANQERKSARELYENKMNFNFKESWKINYHGLSFRLPKKFKSNNYFSNNSTCMNGSDCKTYSFNDLNLYFGISEINQDEISNIRFLSNQNNLLEAILEDAAINRKRSMYSNGRVSESIKFKKNVDCLIKTILEPFVKTYSGEEDNSALYYIAAIQKNNRFFVVQFCGRADKMRYFLDDLRKIIGSMK
jgi:hypothetical protein